MAPCLPPSRCEASNVTRRIEESSDSCGTILDLARNGGAFGVVASGPDLAEQL
jgi:hypothetical protein